MVHTTSDKQISRTFQGFFQDKLQFSRTAIYSVNRHSLTPFWTHYWIKHVMESFSQKFSFWSYEYMKILYENYGVKNYMREEHRSYIRNFCSCERKPEKIQACTGFEPLTSAIPVQRSTNWEQVVELDRYKPVKGWWWSYEYSNLSLVQP